MRLVELLRSQALERGLLSPDVEIDAAAAFTLVRDMPYLRASSRDPETIIREWRGTCSGKHYLLQALFAELGLRSCLMMCSTEFHLNPDQVPEPLHSILKESDGRIVDVHTYLVLDQPQGEMIVDATWPLAVMTLGFAVNKEFILGQNQKLACTPIETWPVPEGRDPQEFKEELLRSLFTPQQLDQRDRFIRTFGEMLSVLLGG